MKDSYILFKDHKPNFENELQSRLINPSKTELGIISKNIIQNIVLNIQKTTLNNLWKNSTNTIEWFRHIKNEHFNQCNILHEIFNRKTLKVIPARIIKKKKN